MRKAITRTASHIEPGGAAHDNTVAHDGDVERYIEGIYTTRFFKESSVTSEDEFKKAWENGTLALSGHINSYEEAQIDFSITRWKADFGVSRADATKVLAKFSEDKADKLLQDGGELYEKTDYDTAKLAEYELGQAGFTVALSVAGYETIKKHPWMWGTKRVNEDIGGKPRVKSLVFGLDETQHHQEITLDVGDIKRLSAYEPKHSTFFGIYYTITGLHALHVFGGILIMLYNMLPVGLALWHKDREQYTNRIETFGLFWHFVDLVWIFLFPILYIL